MGEGEETHTRTQEHTHTNRDLHANYFFSDPPKNFSHPSSSCCPSGGALVVCARSMISAIFHKFAWKLL